MDYKRLEKSILDVIKEEQLKLGYQKETIRLYYPLSSLNLLLGTSHDVPQMGAELRAFANERAEAWGNIGISAKGDRFCLQLPGDTAEYVYQHVEGNPFLEKLINLVSRHHISMEQVLQLFRQENEHVKIIRMTDEEFDYLAYFPEGEPDEYRYCLTAEGHHIIYHRYLPEDFSQIYQTDL